MLAEMGEHQLTIRNYLRHSNLHVTNKYLQATSEDQTLGTGQIGRCDFADRYFAKDKPDPMNAFDERFQVGSLSSGAYRPLTSPDLLEVRIAST
jgi:hypothetical protein